LIFMRWSSTPFGQWRNIRNDRPQSWGGCPGPRVPVGSFQQKVQLSVTVYILKLTLNILCLKAYNTLIFPYKSTVRHLPHYDRWLSVISLPVTFLCILSVKIIVFNGSDYEYLGRDGMESCWCVPPYKNMPTWWLRHQVTLKRP
jgi:hypothetical protein